MNAIKNLRTHQKLRHRLKVTGFTIRGSLLFLCLLYACNDAPSDSHQSVVPHANDGKEQVLSKEDLRALSTAKGLSVKPINLEQWEQLLRSQPEELTIFSFLKPDCAACIALATSLEKFSTTTDPPFLVKHVFLATSRSELDINRLIRQRNWSGHSYLIEDTSKSMTMAIDANWKGEVPAILISNPSEGVKSFYQGVFSDEEIQAILQPYVF